jgi:hypothetical protein
MGCNTFHFRLGFLFKLKDADLSNCEYLCIVGYSRYVRFSMSEYDHT